MKALQILLAGVLIAGTLITPVYAAVKSSDTVRVASQETINDDLFVSASELVIEGRVNGDVYAAAERVTIRGVINGDLIAAGSTIEITGQVRQDIRVAGNTISLVGARIGDSVMVAGNELNIDAESSIEGALIFGGRALRLDGSIGRGITGASDSQRLNGPVGRTVRVAVDSLVIEENTKISGNLEYNSPNEATIKGEVTGTIVRSDTSLEINTPNVLRAFTIGFTLWALAGAAAVGAMLLMLFPRVFRQTKTNFSAHPWKTAGWGAVALLATIPAVVLLFVTVIGVPLALVLIVVWLLAIYLAKFFVAFAVGRKLLQQFSTSNRFGARYMALLLGLLLYYVLRNLPFVGLLVRFATTIVGLGMLLSLYKKQPHRQKTSS